MRARLFLGAAAMTAVGGSTACGLLAGLGAYAEGPPLDAAIAGESASADVEVVEAGQEPDEAAIEDASVEDGESEAAVDAMTADVEVDAAAACKAQCGGCCDSAGMCHGGLSDDTCGASAAACEDCATSGMVCSAEGACAAPSQVDSGAKTCDPTQCTNKCPLLPLLEAPCCKSDHTCGCGAVLGVVACN